jgi:hypothetical protein
VALTQQLRALLFQEASAQRIRGVLEPRIEVVNKHALTLPWEGGVCRPQSAGSCFGPIALWYDAFGDRGVYFECDFDDTSVGLERTAVIREAEMYAQEDDAAYDQAAFAMGASGGAAAASPVSQPLSTTQRTMESFTRDWVPLSQ